MTSGDLQGSLAIILGANMELWSLGVGLSSYLS